MTDAYAEYIKKKKEQAPYEQPWIMVRMEREVVEALLMLIEDQKHHYGVKSQQILRKCKRQLEGQI